MSTIPPPVPSSFGPMPDPSPGQQRKTNTLVYVLLGIAAFIIVGGIVVVGGAYYFVKNTISSGNAGPAIVKLVTALNPDLEVISMDGDSVKVRVKSTGEETEVNLSDLKRGKIDIQSKEGRVIVGGKGKLPDWLPNYPGISGEPITHVESTRDEKGTLVFKTGDFLRNGGGVLLPLLQRK